MIICYWDHEVHHVHRHHPLVIASFGLDLDQKKVIKEIAFSLCSYIFFMIASWSRLTHLGGTKTKPFIFFPLSCCFLVLIKDFLIMVTSYSFSWSKGLVKGPLMSLSNSMTWNKIIWGPQGRAKESMHEWMNRSRENRLHAWMINQK